MREINNEKFGYERALYASKDTKVINCQFEGEEDGESALKECENIEVLNCFMDLRYPLWHCEKVKLSAVRMTDKCRAALWYTTDLLVENSYLLGIKALRECNNIEINNSQIDSQEFGWRCDNITADSIDIKGEYLFFESKKININNMQFKGKYSFQYVEDMRITNSNLDTKDAFWHSKNVTVENSVLKGEYLAWYSENLTLINCKIIGTQPLCYCKNLKLINCQMIDTDLAFEYSDVNAIIVGDIVSVKNPKDGKIVADGINEIIITADSKYKDNCKIVINN